MPPSPPEIRYCEVRSAGEFENPGKSFEEIFTKGNSVQDGATDARRLVVVLPGEHGADWDLWFNEFVMVQIGVSFSRKRNPRPNELPACGGEGRGDWGEWLSHS